MKRYINITSLISYLIISVLLYITLYLNYVLFFQSARVMEGGYICVDNSGLLQKVYKFIEE